jgi:hypothetical protein
VLARVNPVCWLMECPLCDGMRYVMCSSAATMHNCGNQASLGIVHYSAADAATSAGLLPSLMRIERPIDQSTFYLLLRLNDATRSLPVLPELLRVSFQVSVKVILRQSRYDWEAFQSC